MKTKVAKEASIESTRSSCSFWPLYLSRFVGAWCNRQWWFVSGMFVFQLFPKDLTANAYLGLAQCLSQILFGSMIGDWIDNTNRLYTVRVFIVVRNACAIAVCVLCAFFFSQQYEVMYTSKELAIILILLSGVYEVASLGDNIVVQRYWVVQICQKKDNLAVTNTIFQILDLSCKTMTVLFVGLLIHIFGYSATALVLAIYYAVAAVIQWITVSMIYKDFSTLLKSKNVTADDRADGWLTKLRGSWIGWKLYFTHPTRNAGLSLACLFLTVLTFGNALWAYSLLQCITEFTIAILVAAGAINGIMGSMAFPLIQRSSGVECAGQIGLLLLLTSLAACVISVFLPGSPWRMPNEQGEDPERSCPITISIYTLLGGVCAGRFGLWLSDVAITQIQQEKVEKKIRGKIGGVQGSLNAIMDLLKFVFVLLLPSAADFGYLVLASFGMVSTGVILYTSYAVPACYRRRKSPCDETDSTVTPLLPDHEPSLKSEPEISSQ